MSNTNTCAACIANELAFELRQTQYHSDAHLSTLRLAESLSHAGCTLDPATPIADRMLVTF